MFDILGAIKKYLLEYEGLKEKSAMSVDSLSEVVTSYSIITTPGDPFVEKYIDGSSLRQYTFALQSTESTGDDESRLANLAFYQNLAAWLEANTESGDLPDLDPEELEEPTGLEPDLIEALNLAFLFEQGESQTGVYQIQCRLVYTQPAP